mmetsp:Transcript_1552/g.4532  ORF Transcript_1552/g.4532 Transcript_1552/m.4532 type:complete len:215 (+) Transcript_1552:787-1431(+)
MLLLLSPLLQRRKSLDELSRAPTLGSAQRKDGHAARQPRAQLLEPLHRAWAVHFVGHHRRRRACEARLVALELDVEQLHRAPRRQRHAHGPEERATEDVFHALAVLAAQKLILAFEMERRHGVPVDRVVVVVALVLLLPAVAVRAIEQQLLGLLGRRGLALRSAESQFLRLCPFIFHKHLALKSLSFFAVTVVAHVHHVHEHGRPLDVSQKGVA